MLKKITVALACLCIALGIALGMEHYKLVQAQEENADMRRQIKEIRVQVDHIWAEYMGIVKRAQQYGGQ